ncbi:hypothetical protein Droror1_Dr00020961 [Drosera rotundifolia]
MIMFSLSSNDLCRIFDSLDRNRDGLVSLEELNWLFDRTGIHTSLEELETLIVASGHHDAAALDLNQFCHLYESISLKQQLEQEERGESSQAVNDDVSEDRVLYEAFKVFDLNGDGLISPDEIVEMLLRLGLWNGILDHNQIMREYDTNSDGFIDFQEFKRMMALS